LKFEKDLPGLVPLKTWGKETNWEELQTFAVRYDRRSKQEAEKKGKPESQGFTGNRPQGQRKSERLRGAQGRSAPQRNKQFEKPISPREHKGPVRTNGYQRRNRSRSQGRQGKPSGGQVQGPSYHKGARPDNSNYVSKDEWDKLTPEQQNRIREQRAKQKPAGKNLNDKDKTKSRSVRSNEVQRQQE